jgi:hypothetical protein
LDSAGVQKSRLQNPGLDFREGLPGPSPPNSRLAAWTLDLDSGFWISAPRAESKRFLESRLALRPLDSDSAFWILSQLVCKNQAYKTKERRLYRQPWQRRRLALWILDLDSGFWIMDCARHRDGAKAEWTPCELRSSLHAAVAPLRCLNEVGSVAVGTPQRALRVARLVGGALVEQVPLLDELLRSLATIPVVCALLAMLPARDNMTSAAECSACVVCGGRLTTTDQSITLPLFSARGVKTVHLFCRMRLLCDAPPLVRSRRHVSCEW